MNKHPIKCYIYNLQIIYIYYSKSFFFCLISLLVCMLCRSTFLIIPNSQGPNVLNWLLSLTSRTLDVINRLFSQVLTQTQRMQMHPCMYMRRYIHVYTPTDGRPVRGLPSVGVYTCMYLRTYIHGCIYMRVCGWDWVSCMDYEGLQRWKKGTG